MEKMSTEQNSQDFFSCGNEWMVVRDWHDFKCLYQENPGYWQMKSNKERGERALQNTEKRRFIFTQILLTKMVGNANQSNLT